MANKKIIPVVDALKKLYGKLGGTPADVENISTTAEMLKGIYETMGGTPEDVEDLSTTTELIQAIADVATPGGGGVGRFTTAKINFINGDSANISTYGAFVTEEGPLGAAMTYGIAGISASSTTEENIILVDGVAMLTMSAPMSDLILTGGVTYNSTFNCLIVTGDCSISKQ